MRAAEPGDFYGMHVGNDTDVGRSIGTLKDLGIRWVRLWCNVTWTDKKKQSVFDAARMYKAAGFKVIFLLAHDKGSGQSVPSYAEAKAYCQWILDSEGMKDAVDIWEIANELNLKSYWGGTLQEYTDNLLKAAWDVLHPAGEKVLGGSNTAWQMDENGKNSFNTANCERLKATDYLKYCDYAGTHPYTEHLNDMVKHVRQVKAIYGDKPLIATEWNFKQRKNLESWAGMLSQARDSLQGLLDIACFYRLIGFTSEGGWPGLVNYEFQPVKPFYGTYKGWSKPAWAQPADKQPPSAPTGLSASLLGPTLIHLEWQAAQDNRGTLGYSVYRNGAFVNSVFPTSINNGYKIKSGTEYSFTVLAFDSAGNVSSAGSAAKIATPYAFRELTVADAYVAEATPDSNYGGVMQNLVKGAPGFERRTYLKFAVGSYKGKGVVKALLHLKVGGLGTESNKAVRLEVHALDDTAWKENGITWKNRPSSATKLTEAVVSEAGSLALDVTEYVKSRVPGQAFLSLAVVDGASANRTVTLISRKDAANGPVLEILEKEFSVSLRPRGHALGPNPEPASRDALGRQGKKRPARLLFGAPSPRLP